MTLKIILKLVHIFALPPALVYATFDLVALGEYLIAVLFIVLSVNSWLDAFADFLLER